MDIRNNATGMMETLGPWSMKESHCNQQTDGNSCGIFTLMNAECIARGVPTAIMRQVHCHYYREYVEKRLRMSGTTKEDNICDMPGCNIRNKHTRWVQCCVCGRWMHIKCCGVPVKAALQEEFGGVTQSGLRLNITVGILFIEAWLRGHRKEFVLPDRNKYVSMDRHFLKSYMDLIVKTCHHHGAHATGGMAALLLPNSDHNNDMYQQVMAKVTAGKRNEIDAGVDGFMVYDLRLLQPMQQGGVTQSGLRHNITVGILFIEAWLRGQGHYYLKGAVEDSATAEISRSQVWQWIRHKATLEDTGEVVSMEMVHSIVQEVIEERFWSSENTGQFTTKKDKDRLITAAQMFEEIVTKRDFPEFITTYLNQDHTYLEYQRKI